MPEAAELYRPDPELPELIEETSAAPDETAQSS
jgi:hypothetical protein